ncbi:ubiquitin family protein [Ancylostoma ceylanicum]|uniref:Ubiquitin family protein n=2 Tax=Ancylostoma ceylanicum TaxID=53326 RepID=A0A8I3B111_9BILA|nr:ubiquitin family protein [Ancylostoma ceylanicum]EYC32610.1 hypothetical protein Y032_0003g1688 [Ancylostoma ceylanicum]
MKISVKNRADGNVFQIEIDPTGTLGELRSKICSQLGNSCDARTIRILLGAQELNLGDGTTLKDAGIVSGDRLFLEMGPSTSTAFAKPQNPPPNVQPKKESDDEMDQDSGHESITAFKDRVVRAARDYMEDFGYSNTSLQSWGTDNLSGVELHFERRTKHQTSDIFVLITALSSPSLSAIVNVGRTVDRSRKLLSSFTVQPASVKDNVINGVAVALSGSAATGVTLVHLLSLRCIRDQILKHMEPRAVVRLSGVNRLMRSILHAPSVDRTYWIQRLSSEFGTVKVQEAQRDGRTFRSVYAEEHAIKKLSQRAVPLLERPFAPSIPRGIIIPHQEPPPAVPDPPRNPYGPMPPQQPRGPDPPRHPDPLFPAPDPLQPIPDPNPLAVPPRINPYFPDAPFGGRNRFDPFDPDNREIFPGRPNQGAPRGGPRYFPANRWDRGNDFI